MWRKTPLKNSTKNPQKYKPFLLTLTNKTTKMKTNGILTNFYCLFCFDLFVLYIRTWSHTDLCYVPEVPSFNNSLVDGVGDEIIVYKLIYSNIYFYPMS